MILTRSSPSELFLTPRICDPHIPQRQPSISCPRFPTNTVTSGTISHASNWGVIFDSPPPPPHIIRSITIHNSFHARLSLPISIPAATAYICLSSSLSELLWQPPVTGWVMCPLPKFIHWSPCPQYLRLWLYLEIGPLKRQLSHNGVVRWVLIQ